MGEGEHVRAAGEFFQTGAADVVHGAAGAAEVGGDGDVIEIPLRQQARHLERGQAEQAGLAEGQLDELVGKQLGEVVVRGWWGVAHGWESGGLMGRGRRGGMRG